jgi:lycopene cyclase domain-containing protein
VTYTVAAAVAVAVVVLFDLGVARTALVRRRAFWVSYAIVLFFQLLTNGVLTGLRIVRYDEREIVGWRIAYAPVEDLLFGFSLVLATLSLWVWAGRRAGRRERGAARPHPPTHGEPAPPGRER